MSVQSIERAFAVLRTLATGAFGVTELAEQIDLPKSTVARLLSALEAEGAVTQVEQGGEYRLGQGLLDIAGATEPGRNLVEVERPEGNTATVRQEVVEPNSLSTNLLD